MQFQCVKNNYPNYSCTTYKQPHGGWPKKFTTIYHCPSTWHATWKMQFCCPHGYYSLVGKPHNSYEIYKIQQLEMHHKF
jgi:hypothetical protein